MKRNKVIVTDRDYREARFMMNTIASVFPPKSAAGRAILQSCEKVIMMYHFQNKGIQPAVKITNPANAHGEFAQNRNLFFGIRSASRVR